MTNMMQQLPNYMMGQMMNQFENRLFGNGQQPGYGQFGQQQGYQHGYSQFGHQQGFQHGHGGRGGHGQCNLTIL